MSNPIEKALNRLHEYAVLHPEHDTDEILTDARTHLKEFKKKTSINMKHFPNPNEASRCQEVAKSLQELAAWSAGYAAAKDSIKELSQEESYVLWTSLNTDFKELRSGWDDFTDFDLFARAYISQCLKNQP